MSNLGAFFRTVRYLQVQQIVARVDYRLRRKYYASIFAEWIENPPEVPKELAMTPPQLWSGNKSQGKEILKYDFTFIGRTISIGGIGGLFNSGNIGTKSGQSGQGSGTNKNPRNKKINWKPNEVSLLWQFNLHYFEWLSHLRAISKNDDKAVVIARKLILNWINEFERFDKMTWHPYPLSLRLVSWLTHSEWLFEDLPKSKAGKEFKTKFLESITRQSDNLLHSMEWDIGGNHLLKNLKAVIYSSLCLPNRQSFYIDALELLLQQLKLQILEDGGHYELSPSYHMDVLGDLLDIQALIRKSGQTPPLQLDEAIDKMAVVLEFYRHGDKKLALFNDSELRKAKDIDNLLKRCATIDEVPNQLKNTGYVRLQKADTLIIADAGKCCPDDLPGHAHADTLAFEMSLGAERVFVNQGTYLYQHKLRNKFRGTAAHNTVCIDGENSAEVWSAFRLGRRPTQVDFEVKEQKKVGICLTASHNGYRHLGVIHNRTIFLAENGNDIRGEEEISRLKVKKFCGMFCKKRLKQNHKLTTHFHLHPKVKCKILNDREALLTTAKGRELSFKIHGGTLALRESSYAPEFGKLASSKQLIIKTNMKTKNCTVKWAIKVL